ncbi:MAG TPA: hypothetical protein PK036_10025 [Geobacteraceae bacterium]|nr:hypothetical protein [Geobacteraceae bacterium]
MCLENLCREVAREHRLPAREARALLERTLSEALTDAFGRRVIVFLSGEAIAIYRETGRNGPEGLEQLSPRQVWKEVIRLCRYRVETELNRRKAIREYDFLKTLQGAVVRGVVDRVMEDGSLAVLFPVDELFNCREVAGTCPVSMQPPRERGTYRQGEGRSFFVSSVRLVDKDQVLRVDILLSRTTLRLPEALLKMETGMVGIRCIRRIAGRISLIESRESLPREAILAVAAELGERVKVTWASSAGP